METREAAYDYMLRKKKGTKAELIEEIGADLFNEFRLIGYLKEGVDGTMDERWKITDFGASQIGSYLEFYEISKRLRAVVE